MANSSANADTAERQKPLSQMAERSNVLQRDREIWSLQQRYEDYLRSAVDWIWECDANLSLTYISSPVALSLGIPAQLLKGRRLLDLGHFEGTGKRTPDAEQAIQGRRPFRNARFLIKNGGTEIAYRLSGVATFDETKGQFTGYRGTAVLDKVEGTDGQTSAEVERKLVETLETVLARNIELETELATTHRQEMVTDGYLARLAHELRTPLNAILGYAQLASREPAGPLPGPYTGYLQNILTASRHLETLLADLDRSSREPTDKLESQPVDVAEALQEAKRIVLIKAGEAGIDLSRVGPIQQWRVRGDRRACIQILVNLLSNAVKYTPSGGAVGAEARPTKDGNLEIKVWDTGIGIPESEQAHVFQSNYRADHGKIGHQSTGRGLGLAIVRDLARAMKGDIRLESMAGTGSCFILSLPLERGGDSLTAAE